MVAAGHEMVAAGQKGVVAGSEMAALGHPGRYRDRCGDAALLAHRLSRISHGVRATE